MAVVDSLFPKIPWRLPARATFPRDGQIVLFAGIKGCGKTTLLYRSLAWDVLVDGRIAWIYDGGGDVKKYVETGGVWGKKHIPVSCAAEVSDARSTQRALDVGKRILIVNGSRQQNDELVSLWLEFADRDASRGWVLVVDEAEFVYPNVFQLKGPRIRTVKLVRNRAQRLYLCCHRPQNLNILARQNADHALVYRADSESFVKGCSEWGDTYRFEGARDLERFEAIHWQQWRDKTETLPIINKEVRKLPWRERT
jgi:hypothetical protein